jgi:hypothetical protein
MQSPGIQSRRGAYLLRAATTSPCKCGSCLPSAGCGHGTVARVFAPQRFSCSEVPSQADDEHSRIWQPPVGADEVMAGIEGENALGEEKPAVTSAPDEDEGMVL